MIEIMNYKINLSLIISPIIYIVIAMIVYNILKKILKRIAINSKKRITKINQKQRVETLISLIISFIKYIIVIVVVLAILGTYGVNVTSIVAGLGITTAIIGLAFQDLAKDLIAGFSIITEAQYEVGDTIEVDGFMGEVVYLGLKTTRIRNFKGATKIIANHNMDKIINYSLHNSMAVVDVGVAYEEDADKAIEVLTELSKELEGKIPNTTGTMNVLGIIELDDSSVNIRVTMETGSMKQYEVERRLRKEIKRAFDEKGIKIPYPQIEVHNGK
ncbi:MAG: mechanosensitive ion channel family protein [Bacilli bacterium]|nr:mechanosensitive ion channel family protein [Bacilli bacterium]